VAPSPDDARNDVAEKKDASRGKGKGKTARARAKPPRRALAPIVESSAPPPADEATAASPQTPGTSPQPAAPPPQQQQTTISTSRGFVDFLATNHLSLALTGSTPPSFPASERRCASASAIPRCAR